jgi:hypothetical protein
MMGHAPLREQTNLPTEGKRLQSATVRRNSRLAPYFRNLSRRSVADPAAAQGSTRSLD